MSRFGAAILGCAGLELTADEKALFREVRPFGFILFARNNLHHFRSMCLECNLGVLLGVANKSRVL